MNWQKQKLAQTTLEDKFMNTIKLNQTTYKIHRILLEVSPGRRLLVPVWQKAKIV